MLSSSTLATRRGTSSNFGIGLSLHARAGAGDERCRPDPPGPLGVSGEAPWPPAASPHPGSGGRGGLRPVLWSSPAPASAAVGSASNGSRSGQAAVPLTLGARQPGVDPSPHAGKAHGPACSPLAQFCSGFGLLAQVLFFLQVLFFSLQFCISST